MQVACSARPLAETPGPPPPRVRPPPQVSRLSRSLIPTGPTTNSLRWAAPILRPEPPIGQRTSLTDNFGSHTFNYAANGNLVAANHPASSGLANEAYSYDAAGNRSTVGATSTFDAADRLLTDATFNYVYMEQRPPAHRHQLPGRDQQQLSV